MNENFRNDWPPGGTSLCPRIPMAIAVLGMIPGAAYLALFLCGIMGLVDWVGLLAGEFTSWLGAGALGGLGLSIAAAASSQNRGRSQRWLNVCLMAAVALLLFSVPLIILQVVSFLEGID